MFYVRPKRAEDGSILGYTLNVVGDHINPLPSLLEFPTQQEAIERAEKIKRWIARKWHATYDSPGWYPQRLD